MAFFALASERQGSVLYVRPSGELDFAATHRFVTELNQADGRELDGVVVDLRRLQFIDSTGLMALSQAASRARSLNVTFVLVRAPAELDRVFELTGVYNGVEVVNDPAEAQPILARAR